jgi:hypothetical protein
MTVLRQWDDEKLSFSVVTSEARLQIGVNCAIPLARGDSILPSSAKGKYHYSN